MFQTKERDVGLMSLQVFNAKEFYQAYTYFHSQLSHHELVTILSAGVSGQAKESSEAISREEFQRSPPQAMT